MSLADTQYLGIIENILDHGIYGQNRTGIATYKLPQQIMQFHLQEEFPILTTKIQRTTRKAIRNLFLSYLLKINEYGGL